MQNFCLVSTGWGHFTIVAEGQMLVATRLPLASKSDCLADVRKQFPDAEYDDAILPQLRDAVRDYFAGRRATFGVRLALEGMTPFQRAVLQACRKIPYGKTLSYGELAERAGNPGAARAVGSVMRRNPCPLIIPCHRVTASGGKLGGFSGPGGCSLKQAMLEHEGVLPPSAKATQSRIA